MKTALRKDQTDHPRVKSKRTAKTASKCVKKAATKSDLTIALKMYYEFNRDLARTKAIMMTYMNTSRTRSETKSSKTSGAGISGSNRDIGGSGGISVNNSSNQNLQYPQSYKVSTCPIKRSVSSIEMGIPIGKPAVSTTRSNNNS